MKNTEVDAFARKNEPLPDEAGLCDMMLYHILTALYREYKEGIVSKELAKVEKTRAMEKHRDVELWERIYKENTRRITEISKVMIAANNSGCPICQKVAKIYDGRIKQ